MNKQVWKFPIESDDVCIAMPRGSQVLSAQVQNNTPCIWALVDPLAEKEVRRFSFYGTGHEIEAQPNIKYSHIDTFQLRDLFVFHLFELINCP